MGISTEMLMCEDMTLCNDLARRHVVDEMKLLALFLHVDQ